MQIKVKAGKWASARCVNKMQKVANHIAKHYPMDKALHKAFREAWGFADQSGKKVFAAKPAKTTTRRTARKTSGRRVTRRTARRSAPKRRVRSVARRTTRRRTA